MQLALMLTWFVWIREEYIMKLANRLWVIAVSAGLLAGCAGGPQIKQGCNKPNYGAAIIGGIAGGLLGSQIGAGVGRSIAIAAGAGTGAVVGSKVDCK